MSAALPDRSRHRYVIGALAWALFVIYGSLVPLDFRPRPDAWESFLAIRYLDLGVGSRADWIANILLYLVLAYLGTGALAGRRARLLGLLCIVPACLALAIGIEFVQQFFPPRTVSLNDLIAETIGTFAGYALWHLAGLRIGSIWARFTAGGEHSLAALMALYAIAYLALSLFPYDFLISLDELRHKLARPGVVGVGPTPPCASTMECGVRLLSETLLAMPLGALLVIVMRVRYHTRRPLPAVDGFLLGAGLGIAIELTQIALASGTSTALSILTRGIGAAWGASIAHSPPAWVAGYRISAARRLLLIAAPLHAGMLLALNGLLPPRMQPLWAAREELTGVSFLPFYYHYYTSETAALHSLLTVAASYAPAGLAAGLAGHARPLSGVAFATLLASAIETLKLFDPSKRPDPTNVLIAAASAWLAFRLCAHVLRYVRQLAPAARAQSPQLVRAGVRHIGIAGFVAPLLLIAAVAMFSPRNPIQASAAGPTFPPPEEIQPVNLPAFRERHPRLPHPTPDELAQLAAENPGYLHSRVKRANDGQGAPDAVIFSAFVDPKTQDLRSLHERLLSIRFSERGDNQVKQLAQAYDWLHAQWTPAQRDSLRDKLADGCAFVIDYIRRERLSPYNVILYNSPLQALMACSIALYGEHPRSEAFMAFTHDLWIKRVLPVWRQVFGGSGGWHEGGEYVAVGIGQAVYTLPAMWRAATGEDLFGSEPGLRGFLDFLVYRTRPDGSQFRWGDGGFFGREGVDVAPLALTYRHAAAYSRLNTPRRTSPTGWPWGPLTDSTLNDPRAIEALPRSRLFDGIGLIVARSDWSPDATYVSFKAGDNYWSHSHLDQGAFTIYKGGPLAIDSGAYGPRYGSDHHLNYSYQTIAHNTITVTDPEDHAAMATREGARPIANDGGQRRVGSGWGIEPAPLDLDEWLARRDLYHTGRLVRTLDEDDLTVAVADLTPAYHHPRAAAGELSHRTPRVERAWRVFAYDRQDDVVVVYDDVRATTAGFRKRWLLHSIEAPLVDAAGFTLAIPAQARPGRGGGQLRGHVLLPRERHLLTIGGPGFEFYIDGKNYDEDGTLWASLRQGEHAPEPGAWRIELTPAQSANDDRFLVVMLPTGLGAQPPHRVRLLEDGARIGCEVVGPHRTTRWWFTPGEMGVSVEVEAAGTTRKHDLGLPSPSLQSGARN